MSEVGTRIFPSGAARAAGSGAFRQRIEATAEERERLAARFDLVALDRLTATVTCAARTARSILLEAEFAAEFAQSCVVTLEPVADTVFGSFSLVYGPADEEQAPKSNQAPTNRRSSR